MKTVFLYEIFSPPPGGPGLIGRLYLCSVLFFVPAAARGSQVLCIRVFKSARTEGFGFSFKTAVGTPAAAAAIIIPTAAGITLLGPLGAVMSAAAALWALAAGKWISRCIGGLTGDAYGAICELTEVFLLLLISIGGESFSALTGEWMRWLSSFL